MSNSDENSALKKICGNGDCDKDGMDTDASGNTIIYSSPGFSERGTDYLDDVAYYLYHTDLSPKYAGVQNAITYPIGFGLAGANPLAVDLLQHTADNGQGKADGQGEAYSAFDYQSLSSALSTIIGKILEVNSSFVAPVVPTSPENKTYSGERVYLGFFKPISNSDWKGNLKKFGIKNGVVTDAEGNVATDANGKFVPDSRSFWSVNHRRRQSR